LAAVAFVFATVFTVTATSRGPQSSAPEVPSAPIIETSTTPFQAPPPPIMMPDLGQVPCMGWTFAQQACSATQQGN
jgi:hypothetical protein